MQKLENRTIAFLYQCSFEYKSILLSGLYEQINKEYDTLFLSKECHSSNFDDYIERFSLNIDFIDDKIYNKKSSKLDVIATAARKANNRLNNVVNFGYFSKDRKIKWSDYILGNKLVCNTLNYLSLKYTSFYYKDSYVQNLLIKHNVTDIVLCGFSNIVNKEFAINASSLDINIWLILNNWKDIYVNNFIPFTPQGIFSWDLEMKNSYLLKNKHLKSNSFYIVGNLYFDRLYNYKPKFNKNYYEKKYALINNQPIFLYTLLSPSTYSSEIDTVKLISSLLDIVYKNSDIKPKILLRRNPLDSVTLEETIVDENTIFTKHYFEGDINKEIIIQNLDGEDEWLDLIYHSDCVLNVASTVTLEAMLLNKQTINIEFDSQGNNDVSLKKFTQAPFYKPLLSCKNITVCETLKDLEEKLLEMNLNFIDNSLPTLVGEYDGKVSNRVYEIIKKANK